MGKIVSEKWQWLEIQYEYVELGVCVIMPNHFHGILATDAPTKHKPLGGLIGAFKTVSTKHINLLRGTEGQMVWQRSYYEHIIRDEREMDRIARYIVSNPSAWMADNENPKHV